MPSSLISRGNRGKHSFIVKRELLPASKRQKKSAVVVDLQIAHMKKVAPRSQRTAPIHQASNQRQHEEEFFSMNGEVQDKFGADEVGMRSATRAGEESKCETTSRRVPANLEVTSSNLAANISADISAIKIPQRAPQENSMQMSSMMLDQSALSLNNGQG